MRTLRTVAGVLCIAFTLAPQKGPAATPTDLEARVDRFVRTEMAAEKVPGVAIGIFRKGEVLLAKGYGEANVEHHVPVTAATMFQTASVGKQFTAVAVMLQVEDGKLAL